MNEIEKCVEELIHLIKTSTIYQEYRFQEDRLLENPELRERIDQYRSTNFGLQGQADKDSLLEISDRLVKESRELRKDPQANAYLDSELAICKLIQSICNRLSEEVEIRIPNV